MAAILPLVPMAAPLVGVTALAAVFVRVLLPADAPAAPNRRGPAAMAATAR